MRDLGLELIGARKGLKLGLSQDKRKDYIKIRYHDGWNWVRSCSGIGSELELRVV